jgi:ferrochelatase
MTHPGARLAPYDGVLLLSFGGPERPADVMPFLRNVTRGRDVPQERLLEVAGHYLDRGGRSPINEANRALLGALGRELAGRGLDVPLYWGNRNWAPCAVDALREAHRAGARRLVTVLTSAYSSYSGCRQYREDIARALGELAAEGRLLDVDRVRHYGNHPAFVRTAADAVLTGIRSLPERYREDTRVIFVTHSIPEPMARTSGPDGDGYVRQHLDTCRAVAERVGDARGRSIGWDLAYCSRSGPPGRPWLEPDVNEHLVRVQADGVRAVVLAPVGFVCDHMEVVFDLDTEARQTAGDLGLAFARAATAGTDPGFVAGLVDLLLERAAAARGEPVPRPAAGALPAGHDVCPSGCCPNPRGPQPAACGADRAAPPLPTPVS